MILSRRTGRVVIFLAEHVELVGVVVLQLHLPLGEVFVVI